MQCGLSQFESSAVDSPTPWYEDVCIHHVTSAVGHQQQRFSVAPQSGNWTDPP